MLVKVLPFGKSGFAVSSVNGRITIGDNPCLPPIVADTFCWKAVCIECTDDLGEITTYGACRKGRKIVMLPHFSYGPWADPEVASELIKALKAEGYFCEWRLFEKVSEFSFNDKITTLLPLQDDADKQFEQLDSNVKRKIRKCASNGIEVKQGKSDLLSDFYDVYARNMHRLGSPALPRRWFADLLEQYRNGEAAICCAYLNEKPVGAAFLLEYKGFYEACWFSTLQKYNHLYTSYGLYWQMIRYASGHKGVYFSFGRSSEESGVHTFKQQWGGFDLPLVWNYSHPQGKNIRSFTFLPKIWKLLPYQLARFLGPFVAGRFY
jgi:lipid II:glycine glycyltransferase (peptidoglycan interpeptide bridge formation enzyme)